MIDVHANGVVCRAYILDSYHCVFVTAVPLPIYWTPSQLHGQSCTANGICILHTRGVYREDFGMFLPRKSHLDHSGIHVASVLVPHRQLAS